MVPAVIVLVEVGSKSTPMTVLVLHWRQHIKRQMWPRGSLTVWTVVMYSTVLAVSRRHEQALYTLAAMDAFCEACAIIEDTGLAAIGVGS